MRRADEEVFEVEPGLAAEGRERREEQRKADRLAFDLGQDRLGGRPRAEEVRGGSRRRWRARTPRASRRRPARGPGPRASRASVRRHGRIVGGEIAQGAGSIVARRRVFEADVDAVAVGRQPFLVGEDPDVGGDGGEAVAVD